MVKPIPGFGKYWISSVGNVYSSALGPLIMLRPGTKPGGYLFVGLTPDLQLQRRVYKMVHRLVAEAFIPNPQDLPEVNHKDGDKKNNQVENLEWCTRSQNTQHALSLGILKRGIESPLSKLTADEVRAIRASTAGSYRLIGARFGVCAQTICNVKRRSRYGDVV